MYVSIIKLRVDYVSPLVGIIFRASVFFSIRHARKSTRSRARESVSQLLFPREPRLFNSRTGAESRDIGRVLILYTHVYVFVYALIATLSAHGRDYVAYYRCSAELPVQYILRGPRPIISESRTYRETEKSCCIMVNAHVDGIDTNISLSLRQNYSHVI